MMALPVADLSGVPLSGAVKCLAAFTGFQNRQQVMQKHGITVIDDTYNASPVSMKAGLEVLEATAKGRRIAVLADMKELGPDSPKFHYEVGSWMKSIRWIFCLHTGNWRSRLPGAQNGPE